MLSIQFDTFYVIMMRVANIHTVHYSPTNFPIHSSFLSGIIDICHIFRHFFINSTRIMWVIPLSFKEWRQLKYR